MCFSFLWAPKKILINWDLICSWYHLTLQLFQPISSSDNLPWNLYFNICLNPIYIKSSLKTLKFFIFFRIFSLCLLLVNYLLSNFFKKVINTNISVLIYLYSKNIWNNIKKKCFEQVIHIVSLFCGKDVNWFCKLKLKSRRARGKGKVFSFHFLFLFLFYSIYSKW